MFRRPGKNHPDDNASLYPEETPRASPYMHNQKKSDVNELSPRAFDRNPLSVHLEEEDKTSPLPHHFQLKDEIPETTLGEGVTFRGELSFERLLRIDGTFEGELLSQGKVIVGPKGKVKANLNLREAVIEGEVEGNIQVQERLELRGEAKVHGDIRAKYLCVDEGVELNGLVQVSSNPKNEV